MAIHRIYSCFIVSLILISIGCTPAESDVSVKIPSFRKYYPILLKEAQKWQSNAYLDEARIFLFPKFSDSYLISAIFFSPSKDLESLAVDIYQNGTVTSESFIQEFPVYQHQPITETDWKIDSQEAMEIMLTKAGLRFLNPEKNDCSFIILKRVLPIQEQPVIWSLSLWDCSGAAQYLYMDANSGEILDSSVINVKPTRFPTRTP
jgi:hypothetical protein